MSAYLVFARDKTPDQRELDIYASEVPQFSSSQAWLRRKRGTTVLAIAKHVSTGSQQQPAASPW